MIIINTAILFLIIHCRLCIPVTIIKNEIVISEHPRHSLNMKKTLIFVNFTTNLYYN